MANLLVTETSMRLAALLVDGPAAVALTEELDRMARLRGIRQRRPLTVISALACSSCERSAGLSSYRRWKGAGDLRHRLLLRSLGALGQEARPCGPPALLAPGWSPARSQLARRGRRGVLAGP